MFTHPHTRMEEERLTREIELRRAVQRARLGPLPDSPHHERRAIGSPVVWLRRVSDGLRAWWTPRPRLGE
jgi:hypothetical protein